MTDSEKARWAEGVWVAHRPDGMFKPMVISVHSHELDARRAAMAHWSPDADVLFVDWDESIESAVAALETTSI